MSFFLEINYYFLACLMLICYFVGSISFGIVTAKLMNLGNLRSLGSGNIGATNVLRTGNKMAAVLTLILDAGKGYLVIFITSYYFESIYLPYSGAAVFIGHIFPIFHKFKGGKGVATFLGIILALNFIIGLLVISAWLIFATLSKKSSVAALGCTSATPLFQFLYSPDEKVLFTTILTVLIWWLHKDNIKRLILKTEPSITFKKTQ